MSSEEVNVNHAMLLRHAEEWWQSASVMGGISQEADGLHFPGDGGVLFADPVKAYNQTCLAIAQWCGQPGIPGAWQGAGNPGGAEAQMAHIAEALENTYHGYEIAEQQLSKSSSQINTGIELGS